jgi:hypothetical protein
MENNYFGNKNNAKLSDGAFYESSCQSEQIAGKIFTVIDLVTRLPVEVWFHTNPSVSETKFETALLNLLPAKTLILLDRGFYHFQFLEQLINQQVDFITRLKAKASIQVLKIFTYDHSL